MLVGNWIAADKCVASSNPAHGSLHPLPYFDRLLVTRNSTHALPFEHWNTDLPIQLPTFTWVFHVPTKSGRKCSIKHRFPPIISSWLPLNLSCRLHKRLPYYTNKTIILFERCWLLSIICGLSNVFDNNHLYEIGVMKIVS